MASGCRSLIAALICYYCCCCLRLGFGLVDREGGLPRPHSLSDLERYPDPSPDSHPHLFSARRQPYSDRDLNLTSLDHDEDVAVVFHSFSGAGKSLLLSHADRSGSSDQTMTKSFLSIRFRSGASTLNIFNVAHFSDDVAEEKSKVDVVVGLAQCHALPVKRIYIVCDAISFDSLHAQRLDRYLKQLAGWYGSGSADRFCIVLNKADGVSSDDIAQRSSLIRSQQYVLSASLNVDIIAVSARDCIGQLIDDLQGAVKRRDLDSETIEFAEVAAIASSSNLTAMMMDSMKATIESMNAAPVVDRSLQLPNASSDKDAELSWVWQWLEAGAKRIPYVDRRLQYDDGYQDTRQSYEQFRDGWMRHRDDLRLYMERRQVGQQMAASLHEFRSAAADAEQDLTSTLIGIKAARAGRKRFLYGFQDLLAAGDMSPDPVPAIADQ